MCSTFHKIFTLWEYPHKSLQQELAYRSKCRDPFSEEEWWKLARSCS